MFDVGDEILRAKARRTDEEGLGANQARRTEEEGLESNQARRSDGGVVASHKSIDFTDQVLKGLING